MGHHSRASDDTLGCPQIFAKGPWSLDAVHQLLPCGCASLNFEPQHASVQTVQVLTVSQLLLRECWQPRVLTNLHVGVCHQELCNLLGSCRLLPNSQTHGFRGLQGEVSNHGAHGVPMHVKEVVDCVINFLSGSSDSTANGHIVTIIILRRALQRHVGTQIEDSTNVWRSEGGITAVQNTTCLGDFTNSCNVTQLQNRVYRRLGEDQLGIRLDGSFDILGIREVNEGELDAKLGKHSPGDTVCASV
mmetsp:Transcript_34131/g.61173  ORF Transcript_34131/g.61173 Transcript_34131/m.61173 type:complete len:246 (+) Transcript_34131:1579-2316(+)